MITAETTSTSFFSYGKFIANLMFRDNLSLKSGVCDEKLVSEISKTDKYSLNIFVNYEKSVIL